MRQLPTCDDGDVRIADGEANIETSRPTYREFAPPPRLRDHVVCFWRHGPTATPTMARVIPDGCIDVIWVDEQPPHVAGPMTAPAFYEIGAGTEIVAVRFRPGVAHRLLGESAKTVRDRDVPLRDLWPSRQAAPWEDVAARENTAAKFAAMADLVAARIHVNSHDGDVVAQLATWMATHPDAPMDELAQQYGSSERQLRRRFDEAIGYGPKRLQRILRLQRLLWLAGQQHGTRCTLSNLAFAAGYADQPHMTREVLALTGAPPGQLLTRSARSAVSEMFKTPVS